MCIINNCEFRLKKKENFRPMKYLINATMLISIIIFGSCSDEEVVSPGANLNIMVSELIESNQSPANADDIQTQEWSFTNWDINFYKENEKVGEWNGYKNTVKSNEKKQVYRIGKNNFNIMSVANSDLKNTSTDSTKVYTCKWSNDGILTVNGIKLSVKIEDNNLVIYYNTNDAVEVSKIFNVTIDNTYGNDLNENGVVGLGIIKLKPLNPLSNAIKTELSTQQIIENFIDQKEIEGGIYKSIRTDSCLCNLILEEGTKPAIALTTDTINFVKLTNQRADSLFNALLVKHHFNVLMYDVVVSQISFYENSKSVFKVQANTLANEYVVFLYDINSNDESWLIAPEQPTGNIISSYDLAQKFHDRQPIFSKVYSKLWHGYKANSFILSDSLMKDTSAVEISNQQIDLSDVSPIRAKELLTPFMKNTEFSFKNVALKLDTISHYISNTTPGFYVNATTISNSEQVSFYYETENEVEYWLKAPNNTIQNDSIYSYELVQKFINRQKIFDQKFHELRTKGDSWLLNGIGYEKEFKLYDNSIDLSNVTPQNVVPFFKSLLNKYEYNYKGYNISLNGIRFKGDDTTGIVMDGFTNGNEYVEFYFNFKLTSIIGLQDPTA